MRRAAIGLLYLFLVNHPPCLPTNNLVADCIVTRAAIGVLYLFFATSFLTDGAPNPMENFPLFWESQLWLKKCNIFRCMPVGRGSVHLALALRQVLSEVERFT